MAAIEVARKLDMSTITRHKLMSLTEECARVSGIPYLRNAYRDEAMAILES